MSALQLITNAQSKEAVANIMKQVFYLRHDNAKSFLVASVAEELGIKKGEASSFCAELGDLISNYLYNDVQNEDVLGMFPDDVDEKTAKLLGRMLVAHRTEWRKDCIDTSSTLVPSLTDF